MTHSPYAAALPPRDKIADPAAADHARAAERHLRFATGRLGLRLPPGASILDFGCGIGTSVRALLAQGYDAHGVDVLEYWGRDFDKYWHVAEKPPAEVAARLRLADPADNRLPFPDATFDFCFSDQVFDLIASIDPKPLSAVCGTLCGTLRCAPRRRPPPRRVREHSASWS
jgi:SAM-dependent methyltransferase